ncbi:MAG: protein-L-isoaspartate O-methyltransferase [Gammaproteobacteria bacterium]|nr:MAG: protein-L-isoaspartate O-methyltransferase [Gammaproteobacteria bacterium]
MDIAQARFNMIEQQVRPWDVLDRKVLDVLGKLRREDFVPEDYRTLAFADIEIPIGHGQVMLDPKTEARLVQELELTADDHVLEIGTGSGFSTAMIASLAKQVDSVEIIPDLSASAAKKLKDFDNITLQTGDAANGWGEDRKWDAILLTGSVPALPEAFNNMLNPGGRLVAVVGTQPMMTARLYRQLGNDGLSDKVLFDTVIPPLQNVKKPAAAFAL